jgi:nucleoside-triphosphatase
MSGHTFLLSGWRGVGKTALCEQVVLAARQASWDVAGLISPPDFSGEKKVGILVEDLRTGERRPLARLPGFGDDNLSSLTPAWVFDPVQLAWGDTVLHAAVPCDLLVIDELGPLELLSDEGWQAGVNAIDSGSYRMALVVVRPELLDAACRRWPQAETIVLESSADLSSVVTTITQRYLVPGNPGESKTENR